MAGAAPLVLRDADWCRIAALRQLRADGAERVGREYDGYGSGIEASGDVEDVLEHWPATQWMQDLGQRGTHARPGACREDDDTKTHTLQPTQHALPCRESFGEGVSSDVIRLIRCRTPYWLPGQDSNLDRRIQSPPCCHYTTRHWLAMGPIIARGRR